MILQKLCVTLLLIAPSVFATNLSPFQNFCERNGFNPIELKIAASEILWNEKETTQIYFENPLNHLLKSIVHENLSTEEITSLQSIANNSTFFKNIIHASCAVNRYQKGLNPNLDDVNSIHLALLKLFPFKFFAPKPIPFVSAPALAAALLQMQERKRNLQIQLLIHHKMIPPLTHLELEQLLEIFPIKMKNKLRKAILEQIGLITEVNFFTQSNDF